MRLEIDTTVSAPPQVDRVDLSGSVDSSEVKSALSQGIKAAQAGNRAQARTSLLRATELDPRNESAWLWLASISEYPEELLGFLNQVLDINANNERALEWKIATHALLSKTFVQRGIDAAQENQKDLAVECFQTALEYNDRNAVAWFWMASLSDSNSVKVSLLEKALTIEPDNEPAVAALDSVRASIIKDRLNEAKSAAVAGNRSEAIRILDLLLEVKPDSIEAWTMRSHLAEGFDEKIRCFDSILEIDPENVAAKAGRDSLLSIFGSAEASPVEILEIEHRGVEDSSSTYAHFSVEPEYDKSPTQDLEMPADFVAPTAEPWIEPVSEDTPKEEYDNEHLQAVAEPFASFAEETAKPYEAAPSDDVELTTAPWTDSTVEPHDEEYLEPEAAHAEPESETIAFSYDTSADAWKLAQPEAAEPDVEWPVANSEPSIAIPVEPLSADNENEELPVGATFVETTEVLNVRAESIECPFCHATNEPQVISCQVCMAVLTLSDLELLLANQNSDTQTLRRAVEEMERERATRELGSDELVTLGLGHLNLRNLQLGYVALQEASKLSPNNVVLSGQVNSLLIRLEEIKKQEEAQLRMPKGKSILVVDDSPTVRKLIAGKLEKSGHQVVLANDGVEAMERLENFVPDLVLLDITMPRMDGYQVCKLIRSNNATKDVTVVMISGKDGFFDKVRGRMAGTTGYITKPFGPETLMKAVEMYLSGEAPALDEA